LKIGVPKILVAEVGFPEVNLKKILRSWWGCVPRLVFFGFCGSRYFSVL
jgi:hypothetical protein